MARPLRQFFSYSFVLGFPCKILFMNVGPSWFPALSATALYHIARSSSWGQNIYREMRFSIMLRILASFLTSQLSRDKCGLFFSVAACIRNSAVTDTLRLRQCRIENIMELRDIVLNA